MMLLRRSRISGCALAWTIPSLNYITLTLFFYPKQNDILCIYRVLDFSFKTFLNHIKSMQHLSMTITFIIAKSTSIYIES